MKFIVELHSRNMHGAHLETWKYNSRDLALCRVTQLLIANPTADLTETIVIPSKRIAGTVTRTFRLELP